MRILLLNIFLFFSIKVFAIELIFPLKCSLGENCHIQYYYNHASGSDLQDYSCGSMTIPKVKGTSIRLSDTNELVKGYEIIAAAKGKITSKIDLVVTGASRAAVKAVEEAGGTVSFNQ